MSKRLLSIGLLLGSDAFHQPTRMRPFTKASSSGKPLALYASNVDQHQKALDNARSLALLGAISAVGVSLAGLTPEAMHPLHLAAMHPWHLEHSSAFVHLATQANALTHCNLFYVEPAPPPPMQVDVVHHMLAMLGKAAPPPPLPPPPLQMALAAAEASAAQVSSAVMGSAVVGEATSLVNAYNEALRTNYDLTTAVQAFVLVGMGDAIAQKIEKVEFDPVRTLRMGSLGLVIGGIGTSHWLKFLESQLPGHATAARVVEKSLIDACFWAPIANGAYLGLTPLVEGAGLQRSGEVVQERFAEVMKTELKTFTPYNLVAFSLIPPLLRPFTTGFVSMCFGVYISYITHLTPTVEEAPAAEGASS